MSISIIATCDASNLKGEEKNKYIKQKIKEVKEVVERKHGKCRVEKQSDNLWYFYVHDNLKGRLTIYTEEDSAPPLTPEE